MTEAGNGSTGDPEQVSIAKTELETLRASAASQEELETLARDQGFESAKDMLEGMADALALANDNKAAGAASDTTDKSSTKTSSTEGRTATQAPNNDLMMAVADSVLRSHWVEFDHEQLKLPEDQRIAIGRKDLDKLIKSDAFEAIKRLSSTTDGNIYAAAARYNAAVNLQSAARAAGAQAADAKAGAAATASLATGGRAAESAPQKTPEQVRADYNENESRRIAGLPPLTKSA